MIRAEASQVFALAARLDAVPGIVSPASSSAVAKTAAEIVEDAKALAPVNTGALRASISADIIGPTGLTTAEIGPTVDYGIEVEYGTSRQAPQPFMRPAFEADTPHLEDELDRITRGVF